MASSRYPELPSISGGQVRRVDASAASGVCDMATSESPHGNPRGAVSGRQNYIPYGYITSKWGRLLVSAASASACALASPRAAMHACRLQPHLPDGYRCSRRHSTGHWQRHSLTDATTAATQWQQTKCCKRIASYVRMRQTVFGDAVSDGSTK